MAIDIGRTTMELTETRLPNPDVMGRPHFPHASEGRPLGIGEKCQPVAGAGTPSHVHSVKPPFMTNILHLRMQVCNVYVPSLWRLPSKTKKILLLVTRLTEPTIKGVKARKHDDDQQDGTYSNKL